MEQIARYIDTEIVALDEAIKHVAEWLEELKRYRTADVVEVVKCKDCEYSEESDVVFGIIDYKCSKFSTTGLSGNDFCSYGNKEK